MSATYGNDPAGNNVDAVRFLTKDTSTSSAVNSDEEIQWLLDAHPSVYYAAAAAAESIAASYADQVKVNSKSVGDLSIASGDAIGSRVREYRNLADKLRLQAAMRTTPFTGGISRSVKSANRQNDDWDKPSFSRGMMANPQVSTNVSAEWLDE
jgi:hypothetical protein